MKALTVQQTPRRTPIDLSVPCLIWSGTLTGLHRQYATHLVLANPRPIEPIVCRGALGLWTVPDHLTGDLK